MNDFHVWFPEPAGSDETYAYRSEHTLDWLARSINARATDCRRFLNEHISKLPIENQAHFVHDLRAKWHSTFFELIVARLLQELGASIAIEMTNTDRRRPDFMARFPDLAITVEAKAPVFHATTGEQLKHQIPLLNFLESKIPKGWQVGIWELPKIGPADSRKEFERAVSEMLAINPPEEGDKSKILCTEIATGTIRLHLEPLNSTMKRLMWDAPIHTFNNSKDRICHAVKSKRSQVRNSKAPVILAIEASGISSSYEDFDMALFGHTYSRYGVQNILLEEGFKPDGEFTKPRNKPPTYAGVLAFLTVGFTRITAPVLYHHPRFAGQLPQAFSRLEQRWYNEELNEIQSQPGDIETLLDRLHFVRI